MERRHVVETSVGRLGVRVIGRGQPAVLWHSLFVDDRSWDRLVPHLAAKRQLVIITGPGHGSSGDPGRRYSNEECAAAARLTLKSLGIGLPVDWVGNAWGGHVGAIAAATWPELIRSLIMLGSPIAGLTRFERARTYLLLGLYGVSGPSPIVVNGTPTCCCQHGRGPMIPRAWRWSTTAFAEPIGECCATPSSRSRYAEQT